MYYNVKDVPIVNLSMTELIIGMFAIGMAFGVTIGVGVLFFIQIKIIMKNQTGIESWILKKANHRREHSSFTGEDIDFVYPYDLGLKENLRQVFNWTGNFRSIGDGIWWNCLSSCDQFTLTLEQLAQKEEKRQHSVKYVGVKKYNGSILTCTFGCKACICVPWSEEPRITISPNDLISVTRWQRHWVYGEVISSNNDLKSNSNGTVKKGWFPYKCVRVAVNQNNLSQDDEKEEENDQDNLVKKEVNLENVKKNE
jgi:palmitoyltransferase